MQSGWRKPVKSDGFSRDRRTGRFYTNRAVFVLTPPSCFAFPHVGPKGPASPPSAHVIHPLGRTRSLAHGGGSVSKKGGISKFNPVFVSLTSYDPEFASLSKIDPGHAKFFDLGFFDVFHDFIISFLFFNLKPN
jgi:hypothetical protein